MINATFSDSMKKLLLSLTGKEMISYSYAPLQTSNRTYCNLMLSTNDGCIEIRNEEVPLPFFDSTEDVAVLTCSKIASDDFVPALDAPVKIHPVNEVIQQISIVSDLIQVYNKSGKLEYEIQMDQGILIRTPHDTIVIFKAWHFDETLTVEKSSATPSYRSIQDIERDWSDEENHAKCTRAVNAIC